MNELKVNDHSFPTESITVRVSKDYTIFTPVDSTLRHRTVEVIQEDAATIATHILKGLNEQQSISTGYLRELGVELISMANLRDVPVLAAPKKRSYSNLSDQAKTIYRHMTLAGSISAREAMADHGITSATLARRICDIEIEGYNIKRERLVHPLTGKRYTRYSITS